MCVVYVRARASVTVCAHTWLHVSLTKTWRCLRSLNAFYFVFVIPATVGDMLYWQGMTDSAEEGVFKLISNNQVIQFTHWMSGEPNHSNEEDCVIIIVLPDHNSYGQWLDYPCAGAQLLICEM